MGLKRTPLKRGNSRLKRNSKLKRGDKPLGRGDKSPLKKYTKEGIVRRKEKRKGYKEFFTKHVNKIKSNREQCRECGVSLIPNVSCVAHILPKQKYTDIATENANVVYLCGYLQNNCHGVFDGSNKQLQGMKCFEDVRTLLINLIKEHDIKLTIKDLERWKLD